MKKCPKQRIHLSLCRSPRLAYVEFQRLMKIVKMKGLKVSESQLMAAVYTGCDLFFDEGVDSE